MQNYSRIEAICVNLYCKYLDKVCFLSLMLICNVCGMLLADNEWVGRNNTASFITQLLEAQMSEFYINVPLNEEQVCKIKSAGFDNSILDMNGNKIIQLELGKKEQKKLIKGFPDIEFDDNNSCVLSEESNAILVKLVVEMQSLDIMKVAIMKLYNPLAGKDVFGRGTGCR